MPPTPEVGRIQRLVRRVEVLRKAKSQQHRQTNGHVGVSGKIEIELHRIAERRGPARDHRELVGMIKQACDRGCNAVGNDEFFDEAACEEIDADAHHFAGELRVQVAKLRIDVGVANDRTCNEVGKQGHECRVLEQIGGRIDAATIDVDRVRHRIERIEADTDRENDVDHRKRRTQPCKGCKRVDGASDESQVFEDAEQR